MLLWRTWQKCSKLAACRSLHQGFRVLTKGIPQMLAEENGRMMEITGDDCSLKLLGLWFGPPGVQVVSRS